MSDWVPACGGTEEPVIAKNGHALLYMWNRATKEHAYYDMTRDYFLTNHEAWEILT